MVIVGILITNLRYLFVHVCVLVVNVLLLFSCISLSGLKLHTNAVASKSEELSLNL